jgi:hypothetical protein
LRTRRAILGNKEDNKTIKRQYYLTVVAVSITGVLKGTTPTTPSRESLTRDVTLNRIYESHHEKYSHGRTANSVRDRITETTVRIKRTVHRTHTTRLRHCWKKLIQGAGALSISIRSPEYPGLDESEECASWSILHWISRLD